MKLLQIVLFILFISNASAQSGRSCWPCSRGDDGCTHPEQANQAWCDARCPNGINDDIVCVRSHCICGIQTTTTPVSPQVVPEASVAEPTQWEFDLSWDRLTWDGCQSYCSEKNGMLACVNDEEENDFIREYLDENLNCEGCSKDLRSAWIGFHMPSPAEGWIWDGDCGSTFTKWNSNAIGGDSNEPNGNAPSYASLYASDNAGKVPGSWNDDSGSTTRQCVCSVPSVVFSVGDYVHVDGDAPNAQMGCVIEVLSDGTIAVDYMDGMTALEILYPENIEGVVETESSLCTTQAAAMIQPFDCETYGGPLQVLKVGDYWDVRQLDFSASSNGSYSLVYTVPAFGMTKINACGIHPFDGIAYCHAVTDDENAESKIIRFDENGFEIVTDTTEWSFVGGFLDDGRFFYISDSDMYEISNLNTSNPVERHVHSFTEAWGRPSDIVFQKFDLIGNGDVRTYAIGMRHERDLYIVALDSECKYLEGSCAMVVEMPGSSRAERGHNFGAGWVYEGTSYFSDNEGTGVYRVTFEDRVGESPDIRMSWVTRSGTTRNNDGMVCPSQKDVFVGLPTLFPTPSPTSGPTNSPTTRPTELPTQAPSTFCQSFDVRCSNGYQSVFNMRANAISEWVAMEGDDTLKVEHLTSLGFRWVLDTASGPMIADARSDWFYDVPTWSESLNGESESHHTCNFECSNIRLSTSSPTPANPTTAPSATVPSSAPVTSLPTSSPNFSQPSLDPSSSPTSSQPTFSPTDRPTFAEPSMIPTPEPTQTCVSFDFQCESGTGFEGTYVRESGWKVEFVQVNGGGAVFSTGFVGISPQWVFSTDSSGLISDTFDGAFDRINSWSGITCEIICSASAPPTKAPFGSDPTESPAFSQPTPSPITREPTKEPTSTKTPTHSPSLSSPTDVPTGKPTFSTPTWAPSAAPTIPCLSFEATCGNGMFDGVYNFNGYSRKWFTDGKDSTFSITALPDSSLHWTFESEAASEIMLSNGFQADFTSMDWALYDRLKSTEIDSPIFCNFACSVTVTPSSSPSTSFPTNQPVTMQPTTEVQHRLVLENHLVGNTFISDAEITLWKESISQLLHGPDAIVIFQTESMVPSSRRALANPTLNVTAEIVFASENDRDFHVSKLLNENDHLNSALAVYFTMNDLTSFETEYIGLLGHFGGSYYVPTNMPTQLPTTDSGIDIEIVIENPDDGDLDDITDIVDDTTGTTTTVISIEDNGDGTSTVLLSCPGCTSAEDVTDLENTPGVISVQTRAGGARNGSDESEALQVVSSSTTWMLVALITAAIFFTYIGWTGRRKFKRCLACTRKEQKVFEVPQPLQYDIAQANQDLRAIARGFSNSSVWTADGDETFNEKSSIWAAEGDETHLEADSFEFGGEGNVTIAVEPAGDGALVTGYADDDYSDTAMEDLYEGNYESGAESPTTTHGGVALDLPKRTVGYNSSLESLTEYEYHYGATTGGKRTIEGTQTDESAFLAKRTIEGTYSNESISKSANYE